MQSKTNKIKELKYDYYDEISIGDLIFEIDNSDEINLYTIKENANNNVLEKNILIYLKKNRQLD